MDYENVKAMIEARMKKFLHEGNTEAVKACEIILQDLDIFHAIVEAQAK